MRNPHLDIFQEKLYQTLTKEGVPLNRLLDFDISTPIYALNNSIIIGLGIKDGYVEHDRKGIQRFANPEAKQLVHEMQEVAKNYLHFQNIDKIRQLADSLQLDHILVPVNTTKLLLSTAYIDVIKEHEIEKVSKNEQYFEHVKELYTRLSGKLLNVLKANGFNPKDYQYTYQTAAQKTALQQDERTELAIKKENKVQAVVDVLLSKQSLKGALTKGPIYFDLQNFHLEFGIDNYAVIKFKKDSVQLMSDRKTSGDIVKTLSGFLKQNDGSAEIIKTLNDQVENSLLHRNKYKNLVLFDNDSTINVDKKLILEVAKVLETMKPRHSVTLLKGADIVKDQSNFKE